jgi:hypothetical protein
MQPNKFWLGIAGTAVSAVLIFWGLDRAVSQWHTSKRFALLKESKQIEQKREAMKAQLPDLKTWESRLKKESGSLKTAEEKIRNFEKKILATQEISLLLSSFKPTASKGNPSLIQKVTEGPSAEEKGWIRQTFRIQARMQFREILDYMTQEDEGIADPGQIALEIEILHRNDPDRKVSPAGGSKPYWPAAGTDPFLFVQKIKPISPLTPETPRPSGIFFRGLTRYAMLDGKVFQEGTRTPENFLLKRVGRYFVLLEKDGTDLHLALS